jgi:hypothetical protein
MVHVPVDRPVPYPVKKMVNVPVDRPVPFEVERLVNVPVDRPVPYPVDVPVPYPVEKRVEVRTPFPVDRPVVHEKVVTVEKPVPYPVPYYVEKTVYIDDCAPVAVAGAVVQSDCYYEGGIAVPAPCGYEAMPCVPVNSPLFPATPLGGREALIVEGTVVPTIETVLAQPYFTPCEEGTVIHL